MGRITPKSKQKRDRHKRKLQKPSRRTRLRIRYYDFKIQLSELFQRILRSLHRLTFKKFVSKDFDRETINSGYDDIPEEVKNRNCKEHPKKGKKPDDDLVVESDLEPGEVRISRERHYDTNTKCERGENRKRRRRSSLTRKRSIDEESVISAKSLGSGDVKMETEDNGIDTDKEQADLQDKEALLKMESPKIEDTLKETKSGETDECIETDTKEENPTKHVEEVEESDPKQDAPLQPIISLSPPPDISQPKITLPSMKTIWERFVALSNRRRPRDLGNSSKKIFQFGFKMDLPRGKIRGRESIRNDLASIDNHIDFDAYRRSKTMPSLYYGVNKSPLSATDYIGKTSARPVTALANSPSYRSPHQIHDQKTSFLPKYQNLITENTQQPPKLSVQTNINPPSGASNILDFLKNISSSASPQNSLAISAPKIIDGYDTGSNSRFQFQSVLSNDLTSRRFLPPDGFPSNGEKVSVISPNNNWSLNGDTPAGVTTSELLESKSYHPKTQFTAQFYKLLSKNFDAQ